MDVLSMLVCICIQDILVPKREGLLGIVEAYDFVSVSAEIRGPDAIQGQQQHASIESKLTMVWQAAAIPCNACAQCCSTMTIILLSRRSNNAVMVITLTVAPLESTRRLRCTTSCIMQGLCKRPLRASCLPCNLLASYSLESTFGIYTNAMRPTSLVP